MLRNEAHASTYQDARRTHWDNVARKKDNWTSWGAYYHKRLIQIYQFLVAPGQRVIEIGCGTGELLASLKPVFGIGIDLSHEMVKRAAERHPELHFIQCDAQQISLSQEFAGRRTG